MDSEDLGFVAAASRRQDCSLHALKKSADETSAPQNPSSF
jgi:hypothetical protein